MGDIVLPIVPGMRLIGLPGQMAISFDEKIAATNVPPGPLEQMLEAAVAKMWEIVNPGVEKYQAAKRNDRAFHPKNLPPTEGYVPIQEAFLWSSCGAMSAMTGLILANSGVEGLSVLRCYLACAGDEPEGHRTLIFPEGTDKYPDGALLHVNRKGRPVLCALRPGDIRRFCEAKERPVFQLAADATLAEIDGPSL